MNRVNHAINLRILTTACLLACSSIFCMKPATHAADTTPPWMRGISTFNGSGYETNPPPKESSAPSYIVPVDPARTQVSSLLGLKSDPPQMQTVSGQSFDFPAPSVSGELPTPIIDPPIATTQPVLPEIDFSEQLDEALVGDVPPLQQDVIRWYQYPQRWMKGWNSHAEFGLNGSSGNADTLALQTGLEMKRKTKRYTFAIDIDYRKASSRGITTEDNGRLNIDYDRLLGESAWSAFGKLGLESDKFKAFDLRLNVNSGLGYHWIRTDTASFVTRFGAGASKEFGSPDNDWSPEAVFGIDAERQITSRQKLKGKVDYFPAWDNFNDYRLVADVAWEILLDGSENLSLKLAATDRYDSTPQGAKPNDVYYSLLLLYKF